jgi:hypothetical protein
MGGALTRAQLADVVALLRGFDEGPTTEARARVALPTPKRKDAHPILMRALDAKLLAHAGFIPGGVVAYCLTPKGVALLDQHDAAAAARKKAS